MFEQAFNNIDDILHKDQTAAYFGSSNKLKVGHQQKIDYLEDWKKFVIQIDFQGEL